jgi:hypothetical protein
MSDHPEANVATLASALIAAQAAAISANRAAIAAVVAACLSAAATFASTYFASTMSEKVEKDKIIKSMIELAAMKPNTSSLDAFCNVKLWTEGGLIDKQMGEKILEAFKHQRGNAVSAQNEHACDH